LYIEKKIEFIKIVEVVDKKKIKKYLAKGTV
jgi:hypothetical protein